MKLGFVSDSLGGMSFTEMMDNAARMGVSGVEVNTCGWSTAPHCKMDDLLGNPSAQAAFQKEFSDRGLEIISFNANGNPLHPTDPKQGEDLKKTIRLAGEMGIKTVCTMSGLLDRPMTRCPTGLCRAGRLRRKKSYVTNGRKN